MGRANGEGLPYTVEEHRARHVELHKALDELLADYLMQHRGLPPSTVDMMDFLEWSAQQCLTPTEPE